MPEEEPPGAAGETSPADPATLRACQAVWKRMTLAKELLEIAGQIDMMGREGWGPDPWNPNGQLDLEIE